MHQPRYYHHSNIVVVILSSHSGQRNVERHCCPLVHNCCVVYVHLWSQYICVIYEKIRPKISKLRFVDINRTVISDIYYIFFRVGFTASLQDTLSW